MSEIRDPGRSQADAKALAAAWFDRAYNHGDLAVAEEVFAADFTLHGIPGGAGVGPRGPQRNVASFLAAFPDASATVEDQVAEGDLVVTRWTFRGTHQGPFQGIPATGRPVTVPIVVIWRIGGDGKAVEDWTSYDQLGALQQIGVAPTGPPAATP